VRRLVLATVLVAASPVNMVAAQLAEEPSNSEVEDVWTPPTTPTPTPPPVAQNLGGVGESCRARADCESGLRCIASVCRDPLEGTACGASAECGPHLRCYQQVCQSPLTAYAPLGGADERPRDPADGLTTIDGAHGFIGASLMLGPALTGSLEGVFLFALRAGLYADSNELAIEITPFTSLYHLDLPVFQVNVSYAYLIPVVRGTNAALYWPMRFGVGFLTGNTNGNVYVEARADVLGLALQVGQVMVDFHFPSFRFAWTPSTYSYYGYVSSVFLHWFGGVGVSYMF
jgi:hypothetical protein